LNINDLVLAWGTDMKELPIGMQTFKDLIGGGYVYADKTKYVYDLARSGKAYFLSQPRRFGKSLWTT
jgi:hypothetical protein